MHEAALRSVEFDRITSVAAGLALTPLGESRLLTLHPLTDPRRITAALQTTSEGVRFAAAHQGFPLRAPLELGAILGALEVDGRSLEPLHLLGLADYLESVEQSRAAILHAGGAFPILGAIVDTLASFAAEIVTVRRQIEPAGTVADSASPTLATLRERLRRQRSRLRSTLESYLRGRDTSKYLQEQVVTDRNGRYVLVVRTEYRSSIPGVVHGASASGASLFLEPLDTVDVNNDIVAIEEQEAEEVRRILLALTDLFRSRPDDLSHALDVATELDVIQAKARLAGLVDGVEPALSNDGTLELRGARHPLLMPSVNNYLPAEERRADTAGPVPVDIRLAPPDKILIVTGPNTGGKTVAIKTAGLMVAMAQSGLHIPVDAGSRLPAFRTLFADIGDEQSISASLSTFSAHVANVVMMDRDLELPALVLLDEVGAGTDPVEGGALGTAVIDRFRERGVHLIATTHYDSLKSYAATTQGVVSAAFGFDPDTFGPTYRLIYGSPGRSLALEVAASLGMPPSVIASARSRLSGREQQLAEHIAKVDQGLGALEIERRAVAHERAELAERDRRSRSREDAVNLREEASRRRLKEQLDERLREARLEIDAVVDVLKTHAAALRSQTAQAGATLTTGEAGRVRTEARAAVEGIADRLEGAIEKQAATPLPVLPAPRLAVGVRVSVGGLGLEGIVTKLAGDQAELDVRGKRVRAATGNLRVVAPPAPPAKSSVTLVVDLQPRQGSLVDLNLIGCTVDEALTRAERFLDDTLVTDERTIRMVHGHGTGQLRRAIATFLRTHPLVARFEAAPPDQGGGGVTVVELKD